MSEVDDGTHRDDEARAKDAARDRWLGRQGIEVMRVPALWVFHDLSGVTDGILLCAEARIAVGRPGVGLAPSTTRSAAGGPPPAAARGR